MSSSKLTIVGQEAPAPKRLPYQGTAAVVTMGCAKNTVDSEVMLGSLVNRGFHHVDDPANADVIVVNTCGFLQSAVEEGIERVLEMSEYRKEGRCRSLIVAGCMVERYRGDLAAELPEVDTFISTDELRGVGELAATTAECLDRARRPYFLYDDTVPRVISPGNHSAYVKISEGCDRPCSFCIIPKLRGSFRSREIESVVSEVGGLLEVGTKEIVLLGQDLTAYGNDSAGTPQLEKLLNRFEKLYDESTPFWVRLLYAYPVHTDEALIRCIIQQPYIANYLDMPLQHISKPVLKRMRRPLGEKGTRSLIEMIRSVAPEIALRTTFITGFPGETEEDVAALEAFIREGHFTHVGVFPYSQEEEADSFSYDEQVSEEEKHERLARLMSAQRDVVQENLHRFMGQTLDVLIEGSHPETDLLFAARAEWQAPETDGQVIINDVAENVTVFPGTFGRVEVSEALDYDLVGCLVASVD